MQRVREGTERWRYEGMINCGSVAPCEKWSRLSCSPQSSLPPPLFISVCLASPLSVSLSVAHFISFGALPSLSLLPYLCLPLSLSPPPPPPPFSPPPLTLSDRPQPPEHPLTGRIITLVHHCPEKSNNLNLHLPHTPGLNYFIDM